MTVVLGFDTATPATAVALLRADGTAVEARHDPAPGERPGHARELLGLLERALEEAGSTWAEVERLAVGIGPGTFTGLRIGVATARALAQSRALPLVGVSTLRALALGAEPAGAPVTIAVLDARRGEVFAAAWDAAGTRSLAPAALAPDALARAVAALGPGALAVGDGALEFRVQIEQVGATVPADASPMHRIEARHVCRLALGAPPVARDALLPDYVRRPDAELTQQASAE